MRNSIHSCPPRLTDMLSRKVLLVYSAGLVAAFTVMHVFTSYMNQSQSTPTECICPREKDGEISDRSDRVVSTTNRQIGASLETTFRPRPVVETADKLPSKGLSSFSTRVVAYVLKIQKTE